MRLDRARLAVATVFVFIGSRFAPHPAGALFECYLEFLRDFNSQVADGRTFGVAMGAWGFGPVAMAKAEVLRSSATRAIFETRKQLALVEKNDGDTQKPKG